MPTNTVKVPKSSFPQRARTTTSEGTIVTNSSSQELSTVTRIRDFLRMNPLVFMGSKVEGDPHNFIDNMWKILKVMHVIETEGFKLVAYQLKNVENILYEQWEESRDEEADAIIWHEFEENFLDHFFPQDLREANEEEFVNFKQGEMSVKEYGLKFAQLSCYAPEMVPNMRFKMRKFV
ncbi:hypothetical protein MTR67_044542 [Solanum verrucosum]|uniref:Retrotransposon gag domain-containing protein n=1 Tax=Solanum verrucosum TaxID=315347 RepID=A0AAF0URF2_SOLVR|nr:hypothetical protein MTR67_044542 [Solanum verrucosum]